MRLNRRRSGKTCSESRIFVAITLLMTLAAVALTIGSGAAPLRVANDRNPSPLSAPDPVLPTHALTVHLPLAQSPSEHGSQQIRATYNHLPLMFEPNQGQTDARVRFLAHGSGYGLFLTAREAVLAFALQPSAVDSQHRTPRTSVVSMKLAGATSTAEPTGDVQLLGKSNYFIGNDPAQWHRDIPQFARVRYRNVYPGIDLVYYGNQGRLEYDFEVAPGSDPQIVALRFQGSQNLKIDAGGDLVLAVGGSDVRLQAPRVYQKFGAEERTVAGRFELRGKEKDEVGFQLGAYDRNRALIIDPVLTYATYLGGSGDEACSVIAPIMIAGVAAPPSGCPAIAVDAVGNAYVAGSTTSTDFPVTSGVFQKMLATGATANAFIAKFTPVGALQFATYLGGNGIDYPAGIALDGGFNVIVAGTTSSTNFPTNGTNAPFQATPASSNKHVFVSKLDPAGKTLLYSTYLSGSGADIASGLALDSGGNAYVTGTTTSTGFDTGFPSTLGALQEKSKSTNQFFFTKVDPNSSGTASVAYSTYIGGSTPSTGVTVGGGIAVDSNSNAYITGGTTFTDMPVLNAYQATLKGTGTLDDFVTKINPAGVVGAQLLYSTYLGGSGNDVGYGIAVDSSTNAYVTGWTTSPDFVIPTGTTPFQDCLGDPLHHPPNCTASTNPDAFLAKFGILCAGSTCTTPLPLSYFTYLGGSGTDVGTAIAVDSNQGARIAGWTSSTNFPAPASGHPLQTTFGGGASDAFLARIDTLSTANSSSYFGGTGADFGTSIAIDQQGSSYLTGETSSPGGFLGHPFKGALNGPTDAFVSKLGPVLSLTFATAPTVAPSPDSVGTQVSFVYTITNTGDFTNGVTFTDQLQASGATFVSATASPGSCGSPVGVSITCNIGTLNTAATATITLILTPIAPTIPGGPVTLGNSGSAEVGGSTLATAIASVVVNDFSLKVAPALARVPAGVPATFTATVTPSANNGFPGSVSLSCGSGLPTGATCLPGNNNPIPNLNTGPQSSQLIINTTARVTTTTDLRHGGGPGVPLYAAWFPVSGLALLGLRLGGKLSRPRRILMGLLLGGFFALILFQAGCGSSSHTTSTTGTPAGTYPVTINATSGTSATRTTVVTLVVQ
ncbi:MAG TPA: SBBP repeat-containing protein [Terriglobales bacterium]|nr:SBBP repeat-containing protein [Terriglobales bacterium]